MSEARHPTDGEGSASGGTDRHADDQLGRARVRDSDELQAFYAELEHHRAGALWTVANEIEPWFPQPRSVPMLWRYEDIRPAVVRSAGLVSGDDAGRRVIMLLNPGRRDIAAACGLLYTGIQIMNPGESMTAHRHAAAALRFVMEGTGAWTIVNGDKLRVGPRDFAITPRGTWHEHGNETEPAPDGDNFVIWQDGLDIPLCNALDANFYEVHPDLRQPVPEVANHSLLEHGAGILKPDRRRWERRYSPLLAYPWDKCYQALQDQARVSEGSPFDGVIMEYVNPHTGGSVMPTMGAHLQLLRPGESTLAHRHTGSVVYQVAKGRGYSIIDGVKFDWEEKDVFCVPSWSMHEHANADQGDDAVLFSFNDFPVMHSLDLWAEQAKVDDGGHQPAADFTVSPTGTVR